jgi:hypothetical protein
MPIKGVTGKTSQDAIMRRKSNTKRSPRQAKTSDIERRAALVKLGAEVLADTLIDLAPQNKEVDFTIERLISNPQTAFSRFKDQLANLSCLDEFVDWRGLSALRRELDFLLTDLKASVVDGKQGYELVVAFYDFESNVLENCDDDGMVGDIFLHDAVELLGYFGAKCEDKNWLCEELVRLYAHDAYGVRDRVLDNVVDYLSQADMLHLIELLQKQQRASGGSEEHRWKAAIESLARQLKDPVEWLAT